MSENVVGVVGRISGRVGPGRTGEILLPFGHGTSAYLAFPADGVEEIEEHRQAVVVDYVRPLTVYVTAVLPGDVQ